MCIFGNRESEQLLSALFVKRYGGSAWQMLERFLAALNRTELPFALVDQIRRHEYPGYAGYEDGMPTIYYYFVPRTGWGSVRPAPQDPLDRSFVYSMDGFGLNFGCPLRLARAIEILELLPTKEQHDSRHALASTSKHLSAVEELLWFDLWSDASARRRVREGSAKTFDWSVEFENLRLRVECKFRPSDWPRLIDGTAHLPMTGALTNKAREQLGIAATGEINVLAVTGIAEVTDSFRRFCQGELRRAPNIGALIYQRFVGQVSVFSLEPESASLLAQKIPAQQSQPFQEFYFLMTDRQQATLRSKGREAAESTSLVATLEDLTEISILSLRPRRHLQEPPLPYRCTLSSRAVSGEPLFQNVPPYLNDEKRKPKSEGESKSV